MTLPLLYSVPLEDVGLTTAPETAGQRVASLSAVEGDPSVQSTGSNANRRSLNGSFKFNLAGLRARQLTELGSASGIESVPLYRTGAAADLPLVDGYYVVERAETEPARPPEERIQTYQLDLERKGTRKTHRRSVRIKPTSVTNPFDDGSAGLIGLPTTVRQPQWFDPVGGTIETATPTSSLVGERVGYEQYDPDDASFYTPGATDPQLPRLVYDIRYSDELVGDCRVWDTYDREKTLNDETKVGSATVGSATVSPMDRPAQWGRVYDTAHEFRGAVVIESGTLRVILDERSGSVRAFEPAGPYDLFHELALGSSTWGVIDVDLTEIGLASVAAQVTFYDADTGSTYPLNLRVARGLDTALWTQPPNESSSVPSGLQTLLAPIASGASETLASTAALEEREALRR